MRGKKKRPLKSAVCCILAGLIAASSMAIGSALDGVEENELEIQTQPEEGTETQTETQTEADPTEKYILGDVTSDECVNLLDAIAVQKFSLSMIALTDVQKQCGDVDRNEAVNLLNSIMIQKFALGMLSEDSKIGKYFTP